MLPPILSRAAEHDAITALHEPSEPQARCSPECRRAGTAARRVDHLSRYTMSPLTDAGNGLREEHDAGDLDFDTTKNIPPP
jgi:hypothetical protein